MGLTRSRYLPGILIPTTRLGMTRDIEIPRAVIRQAAEGRHVVSTIDELDRREQEFIHDPQARHAREREQQATNPPLSVEEVD